EMGGMYAVPNLRGGGEYGEEWHQEGMLEKKQNVFDDFIAAAEYLIAQGYTATPKLATAGGSNGGLMVGAAITQRPELFGAALPVLIEIETKAGHAAGKLTSKVIEEQAYRLAILVRNLGMTIP